MRRVALAGVATALLGGCVAQPYPAGYYQGPGYYEPSPYGTEYGRRPLLPPQPYGRPESVPAPAPTENGPIPLLEMPPPPPESSAPPAETPPERPAEASPAPAPAAPVTSPSASAPSPARTAPPAAQAAAPTSGPGSNVPLEGFRPMRGQSKPTP